ncbi:structural molecule [Moniliophthora roreri MCA 2997]|uniref:Protein transport protein SEC31 n=2 Tax=Moniliophthora roreri TaxID=221103 RepID=V2X9L6_MONRO|nr:structural molecule [Moniliophthora roreri MCA 2997]KAI3610010.1 structural molecule [Moniliophthora roreri]
MKLKEIHRTSTFAWSPSTSLPLIATGSVAGALDESFSNESQLEIWAPDFLDKDEFDLGVEGQSGPKGVVKDTSRFNRLTWGYVDPSRPRGVIAAGMENGELALWDPSKILAGESATDSLLLRNSQHTGPVRALDFNPIQTNLLSSGAVGGEVYIWDLKDPSKPYTPTPGTRSTKLDEITSVAWNQQVQYVLAGASSTGYTVVWDLRGKREVVALAYGGGAGTLAGQMNVAGNGMAAGGRRGMSAIAWHPDNATRLVTASEDDSSPIIMVWDLRNARAPEKILTGHEKGVLSLSWCKQDADLLLSCGKDNRALCWNPQTSEIIGELPSADNWAFQVEWCPRNPDLLATAFFDGTIGIHSIQSTNESSAGDTAAAAVQPRADGSDIFDVPGFSRTSQSGTLSLKQPPKWLRRPASATFGFGGKLVSVSNLPSAQGKNQSGVVHIRKVVTEDELVARASKLQAAIEGEALKEFAQQKSGEHNAGEEAWKALLSLYQADSRDELISLLGFSKAEVAARVAEAVEKLKAAQTPRTIEQDLAYFRPPVVSFLEPETEVPVSGIESAGEDMTEKGTDEDTEATPEADNASLEKTPSEVSVGASDATSAAARLAETESNTTVPSLFGDDNAPGQPDAQDDFFSTISNVSTIGGGDGDSQRVLVPHHSYGLDSSVAATIGSRPSSVASEALKSNTFRIYPADESETERLVTKALVLGDFSSAVDLCLSSDRFADALLLAVRGGPELLQKTQKAYFERQTMTSPYLRLFQSIVSNDLADIVQNADLAEWQEIFVVLCTFASKEEFGGLAEQLGRRMEFQYTIAKGVSAGELQAEDAEKDKATEYRKNATLTYLAAARLERLVNIWAEEMAEEETTLLNSESSSHFAAHAHALQTFIEKVTVFRSATKYTDNDLTLATPASSDTADAKTYKLATLYDRYLEYANVLASQGLVKDAVSFLRLTPEDYKGSSVGEDLSVERERLLVVSGAKRVPAAPSAPAAAAPAASTRGGQYSGYAPTVPAPAIPSVGPYASYGAPATSTGYAPAPTNTAPGVFVPAASASQPMTSPYAPAASSSAPYNAYSSAQSLTQPPHLRPQQPQQTPPPPGANMAPPPPKRTENGGWNDAPVVNPTSRSPNPLNREKPAAIVSPFLNAQPSPSLSPTGGSPYIQSQPGLPPPPRPGSRTAAGPPPRAPAAAGGSMFSPPPPARPPSNLGGAPPSRLMSPPHQTTPSNQPVFPPPPGARVAGQTPPPGPYTRPGPGGNAPPPPSYARATPPPPAGPYAAPPSTSAPPPPSGPYAPPPGAGNAPPTGQYASPPGAINAPPSGQYGPPPGASNAPPTGAYAPPPGAAPRGPPPSNAGGPPPPGGPGPNAPPPRAQKPVPPAPKYPPGDRSHISDHARPIYNVIHGQLQQLKQATPSSQKRLVEDLERRINPLFDALNCETLSKGVVDQLLVLTRAMESHDRAAALAIHVDLLTRGSQTDDIGLWMSGVKQLITRL